MMTVGLDVQVQIRSRTSPDTVCWCAFFCWLSPMYFPGELRPIITSSIPQLLLFLSGNGGVQCVCADTVVALAKHGKFIPDR